MKLTALAVTALVALSEASSMKKRDGYQISNFAASCNNNPLITRPGQQLNPGPPLDCFMSFDLVLPDNRKITCTKGGASLTGTAPVSGPYKKIPDIHGTCQGVVYGLVRQSGGDFLFSAVFPDTSGKEATFPADDFHVITLPDGSSPKVEKYEGKGNVS